MGASFERSFARDFNALAHITAFVAEFFAAHRIDRVHSFAVEFIIEEIFTNMVKYNSGKRDIAVKLEKSNDSVIIQLLDFDVEKFDITRVPEVDSEKYIAEKKVGGLGLHLVNKMADSVGYEYVQGSSKVTIVKRLETRNV